MLSDEEKQAIEHIKAWIKFEEINGAKLTEFKLVLNLIKKQSKEIEELKRKEQLNKTINGFKNFWEGITNSKLD